MRSVSRKQIYACQEKGEQNLDYGLKVNDVSTPILCKERFRGKRISAKKWKLDDSYKIKLRKNCPSLADTVRWRISIV